MKITVLVDNNTIIDRYFLAEPGLSFYIEDGSRKILFDCGYSGIFLQNAGNMGIDLTQIDALVLSHSHLDHTWGLHHLLQAFTEKRIEGEPRKKPLLITHPDTFTSTLLDDIGEIGPVIAPAALAHWFDIVLTREPYALTDHLQFLGEIPRLNRFESQEPIGRKAGSEEGDLVPEDSALAYKSSEGLVIITGCAHAGICNTIEQAKAVCQEQRITAVIGGLHLQNPPAAQLRETGRCLHSLNLKSLHACHCTDLASKVALAAETPLREVGVGVTLEFRAAELQHAGLRQAHFTHVARVAGTR